MRVTLLHNPKAGGGKPSKDELLTMLRDAGHKPVYKSTKDDDDDWKSALKDPGDLVVAAGGDGTVCKVAKRLVGRGVLIAVLPFGTANNISKTLGITGSTEQLIAGWTASSRRKKIDVGVARGPWGESLFLEGMGCGLFTRVMSALDAQKKRDPALFENTNDALALALRALSEALSDYRSHDLKVTLDGEDFSGRYLLLEAMNIKHVGPNLYLAPDADPGDGYLDFVFLTEDRREEFSSYISHRLEGKQEAPNLPVRRGRHLQVDWEGIEIHFDDEIWPKKRRSRSAKGRPSAAIDVKLEGHALEFLVAGKDEE